MGKASGLYNGFQWRQDRALRKVCTSLVRSGSKDVQPKDRKRAHFRETMRVVQSGTAQDFS